MTKNNILANRATLKKTQSNGTCQQCDDPIIFALQDKHHQFSIGLSTILECLKFAENEHTIPPIPEEWWDQVASIINIPSHQI